MTRYGNQSGDSGVRAYECGPSWIRVQFVDGEIYLYTYGSTGRIEVQAMKALAVAGRGLATYINQHVRGRYERRL